MQGAEGADLERKQILEDQFRAASETLFRKRRDMGQLEGNFKTASLELIDIRNQKQEIDREQNEHEQAHQQADAEFQRVAQNIDRAQQSVESKLNNVRSVRGDGFDESPENLMCLAEAEREKSDFLLNALSHLVNNQVLGNEVPQLIAEIQTTLGENNI